MNYSEKIAEILAELLSDQLGMEVKKIPPGAATPDGKED